MSVLPLTEGARRVDRRGLKNLPAFHHHHPLAKRSTSRRSWVINRQAVENCTCRRFSSATISACKTRSRFETASSRISKGTHNQRPRQADQLQLPAAELVRAFVEQVWRKVHRLHHRVDPRLALIAREAKQMARGSLMISFTVFAGSPRFEHPGKPAGYHDETPVARRL